MIPISPWPGARLTTPRPNRRRTYRPAQPEPEQRPSRAWLVALLLAAGCGAALLADPPCGPGCECERER